MGQATRLSALMRALVVNPDLLRKPPKKEEWLCQDCVEEPEY